MFLVRACLTIEQNTCHEAHIAYKCVKTLCVSGWYTFITDLSMTMIDDDIGLDRILENMNYDYKLIDLFAAWSNLVISLQEHTPYGH